MKRTRLIAIGVAAATAAVAGAAAVAASLIRRRPSAIVQIESGRIAGVRRGDVLAFLGIPYAAPPVGPLRWRPPQVVKPWTGVRAADALGPIALQKHNPEDNGVGPPPMSEDCLTLNVWTPARREAALPVMVWIHGGGFVNGSASAPLYDGAGLARQGVVVVTLNYRLGRFGFFAHPALAKEAPKALKGNYALMDQIAALKWVQRNITAFGGDAANVTLFGESAGGMAVQRLMTSPLARGLFHKAISQSGAGREANQPLKKAEADGKAFAKTLGLTDGASAKDLRAVPADKILEAGDTDVGLGWGPILDGQLLTADVCEAFARGDEAPVPFIAGANALEFPIPEGAFDKALRRLTRFSAEAAATVEKAYPDPTEFRRHVISDVIFDEPARRLVALHARNGCRAFLYRFSVMSKSITGKLHGAPHAAERQYVFRNLGASTWPTDEMDEKAAEIMNAYWIAFAKTGDPNGDERPAWPSYDGKRDVLVEFTNDGPKAIKTPTAKVLDAIAATYEAKPAARAKTPKKPAPRKRAPAP